MPDTTVLAAQKEEDSPKRIQKVILAGSGTGSKRSGGSKLRVVFALTARSQIIIDEAAKFLKRTNASLRAGNENTGVNFFMRQAQLVSALVR